MAKLTVDELRKRIDTGYYNNKMEYPGFAKGAEGAREAYRTENYRLYEQLRKDALEVVGLKGHKKAEATYKMAWEYGHSSGYSEVLNYLIDLAELVR